MLPADEHASLLRTLLESARRLVHLEREYPALERERAIESSFQLQRQELCRALGVDTLDAPARLTLSATSARVRATSVCVVNGQFYYTSTGANTGQRGQMMPFKDIVLSTWEDLEGKHVWYEKPNGWAFSKQVLRHAALALRADTSITPAQHEAMAWNPDRPDGSEYTALRDTMMNRFDSVEQMYVSFLFGGSSFWHETQLMRAVVRLLGFDTRRYGTLRLPPTDEACNHPDAVDADIDVDPAVNTMPAAFAKLLAWARAQQQKQQALTPSL